MAGKRLRSTRYRLRIWLNDSRNKIWLTQAISVVVAVALALVAALANQVVPADAVPLIKTETVDSLLSVIATSMLSVAIFSLGIVVAAFASAAAGATPRATELVMADDGTRRAIGSFIAAFIYAVVAKTALGLEYYGPAGRFVLFVGTVLVLVYLVIVLVLWVRTLSTLGRLGDTLGRIELAVQDALRLYRREPQLGALAGPADTPPGQPVLAAHVGFLTHIDMQALDEICKQRAIRCHVRVRPGAFIGPGTLMAVVTGPELDEDARAALMDRFVVGESRSFEQDPRFGLIVMAEVAQRALSPAVNDPGTAIEVASLITKLVVTEMRGEAVAPRYGQVTMVALNEADLIQDSIAPIARDGAGNYELGMRLQTLLSIIASSGPQGVRAAAVDTARNAVTRARASSGLLAFEVEALADRHQALFGAGAA